MATKAELLAEARRRGITDLSDENTVADIEARLAAADSDEQEGRAAGSREAAAEVSGDMGEGVASPDENQGLEHSQGGTTTRDDRLDQGVPMLQGDPMEPVGPEDAFGPGPKRGDYVTRQDGSEHFESVYLGESVPVTDDDGNTIDFTPSMTLAPQNQRVENVGEQAGLKGGVETAD